MTLFNCIEISISSVLYDAYKFLVFIIGSFF